jgi:hypothetical protein
MSETSDLMMRVQNRKEHVKARRPFIFEKGRVCS